jgi:hypothetical protein
VWARGVGQRRDAVTAKQAVRVRGAVRPVWAGPRRARRRRSPCRRSRPCSDSACRHERRRVPWARASASSWPAPGRRWAGSAGKRALRKRAPLPAAQRAPPVRRSCCRHSRTPVTRDRWKWQCRRQRGSSPPRRRRETRRAVWRRPLRGGGEILQTVLPPEQLAALWRGTEAPRSSEEASGRGTSRPPRQEPKPRAGRTGWSRTTRDWEVRTPKSAHRTPGGRLGTPAPPTYTARAGWSARAGPAKSTHGATFAGARTSATIVRRGWRGSAPCQPCSVRKHLRPEKYRQRCRLPANS